jgi:hypothetical protein
MVSVCRRLLSSPHLPPSVVSPGLTRCQPDHVIGSPLALSDKKYAEKAWVEFKHVKILQRPDVRFIHGTVSKVDCEAKTATVLNPRTEAEQIESYDFFIAATGFRRVWPVVPQALDRKSYLEEAGRHIDAVTNSTDPVLVVGGGMCLGESTSLVTANC